MALTAHGRRLRPLAARHTGRPRPGIFRCPLRQDFAGGTEFTVNFAGHPSLAQVQSAVSAENQNGTVIATSGGGYIKLNGAIMSTNILGNVHINGGLGQGTVNNQTGKTLVLQNLDTGSSDASQQVPSTCEGNDANWNSLTIDKAVPGTGIDTYNTS